MKILQVIPYFWPALSFGGPAKVVYQLSRELARKNIVTVYTSDAWDQGRRIRSSEKISEGSRFKIVYFRNIINAIALKWRVYTNFGIVTAYLRNRKDFELVHINDVFSLPQIILAEIVSLTHKPYVISTHGVEILNHKRKGLIKSVLYKLLVKNVLEKAKSVIATSEGEANVLRRLGLKNVEVVFNGVSNTKVAASKKFKKYEHNDVFTILYIGRINALKGLGELIDSVSGVIIPFQVLIAGPDDGEKNKLVAKIEKFRLQGKIHFLGFVNESQKKELYQISDIFVYPSKLEGFSISILEAMQHSLPVLITKACNFPDVSKYKAGVVLFPIAIRKNISKNIENLYRRRDLLISMGKNANNLIQKKYSIEAMTDKVEKIYKELI